MSISSNLKCTLLVANFIVKYLSLHICFKNVKYTFFADTEQVKEIESSGQVFVLPYITVAAIIHSVTYPYKNLCLIWSMFTFVLFFLAYYLFAVQQYYDSTKIFKLL